MKKGIHPTMHQDATTNCVSCGSKFQIPSTVQTQQVETCKFCHPVYTGEHRGVMASSRVDRFRKAAEASAKKQEELKAIEESRAAKPKVTKKK
jgi:ribosomal protein L31